MQGPPPGFTPEAQRAALNLPTAQAQDSFPQLPDNLWSFLDDSCEPVAPAAVHLANSTDARWPQQDQARLSEACSRLTCPW